MQAISANRWRLRARVAFKLKLGAITMNHPPQGLVDRHNLINSGTPFKAGLIALITADRFWQLNLALIVDSDLAKQLSLLGISNLPTMTV
jgi:hypothetical protein